MPKGRAKRKKRAGKTPGPRRLRFILLVLLLLSVLAGAGLLHVYVSVTNRFDGRLWKLPSRIYSDVLNLTPGEATTADEVEKRLSRCGYARSSGTPTRPGQFRRDGKTLQIHLRAFTSPVVNGTERRVALRFGTDRLAAVHDDHRRALPRITLEPELLATMYGPRQEERLPVRLREVPATFLDAVLAAEDSRYFSHLGLDLRGILRAGLVNVRRGRVVQGGSTITQQTVKNLYLGQERTWWRKAREAVMALVLDARYSKDRILEVYLNEVYLGQRGSVAICGVQAAARFYFGRDLRDLSLGEWALLAGLISSPGRYNPFLHPERATARRDQVLEAMVRLGSATPADVQAAKRDGLSLASGGGGFSQAAYAVDFVQSRLAERFTRKVLLEEGLNVYTTIDTRLQQRAESVLRTGLSRLERNTPALLKQAGARSLQGALLSTRPSTGAIVAMVGGRDYGTTQFNRVVQARRQPGSCFKPLVYAAGFELAQERSGKGLTPATM
ncbi:MAG: transglycosylase domain-containing protein, partial [Planctomycetota bacterium]